VQQLDARPEAGSGRTGSSAAAHWIRSLHVRHTGRILEKVMITDTTTQRNACHLTQREAKGKGSGAVGHKYAVVAAFGYALPRMSLLLSSSDSTPSSPSLRSSSYRASSATPSHPALRMPLVPGRRAAVAALPPFLLLSPFSRAASTEPARTHGTGGSTEPLPPPRSHAEPRTRATEARRRQTLLTENPRTGRSASGERCSPRKIFLFTTNKQNPTHNCKK
jgi:hypothetical protein